MAVSAWTKHCKTDEDREKYLKSLYRVRWVLDDLKTLVTGNLDSREAAEISPSAYDNVNWPYRQAHNNGYKQALRDFNKLITLDPEKDGRQPTQRRPRSVRERLSDEQVERQDQGRDLGSQDQL